MPGSGKLAGAITDLMAVAEDPTDRNLARANDQFSTFLAQEGLVDGKVRRADVGTDLEAHIRTMLAGKPLTSATTAVGALTRSARKKKPTGSTRP